MAVQEQYWLSIRGLKWTPVLGPDVKVWRVLLFPNGWSGK